MGNYQLGEIFACAKMCENLQKFASLQNWSQRFKEDNYQIVQNFCMCKKNFATIKNCTMEETTFEN